MGPPTVFSPTEENTMQQFLLDAWMMRIPRTQPAFADDIKEMLDFIGRDSKFTNNRPG